jgi:hypothetical protein
MNFFQKLGTLFQSDEVTSPLPASRRVSETGFVSGAYELCIPQGLPRDTGHVLMSHRQQYTVILRNRSQLLCDAQVAIDGKVVGCWRIPRNGHIELERPVNDTGRFTFYMLGSKEARQSGLTAADAVGLVTVTFMPERPPRPIQTHDPNVQFSTQRGGTGLSGESGQKFKTVESLDYDHEKFVTIDVRLYCDDGAPRPLKPANRAIPRPLP